MNFSLGTAQFGLNYGVTNNVGKVGALELQKILKHASQNNIHCIDTAIDYGDSEILLGKADISNWRVVTKLPKIPKNVKDVSKWIDEQINTKGINNNRFTKS